MGSAVTTEWSCPHHEEMIPELWVSTFVIVSVTTEETLFNVFCLVKGLSVEIISFIFQNNNRITYLC